MIEHAGGQDDIKVNGGVTEVRKADEGLCIWIVVHAREHLLCDLDGDALDLCEIAVVGDADGDADIDALRG